jgi:hypothetical protein
MSYTFHLLRACFVARLPYLIHVDPVTSSLRFYYLWGNTYLAPSAQLIPLLLFVLRTEVIPTSVASFLFLVFYSPLRDVALPRETTSPFVCSCGLYTHRLLRYRMSNKRNVRDRTVRSRAVRPSCVIPCGSCEFESIISSPFVFPQGTATATRRLHTVRVHVAGQLAILPRARTTAVDNFPIFFGAAARMSIVCISYPTPRCCCRRLLRWFRYAWLYEPRIVGHRNQQG